MTGLCAPLLLAFMGVGSLTASARVGPNHNPINNPIPKSTPVTTADAPTGPA